MDTAHSLKGFGKILLAKWRFLPKSTNALLAVALMLFANLSLSANLQDISFNALPGGQFEVRMDFDSTPPEPQGYNIEKPARIALDMIGVSNQLSQKKFPLSYDNANSAMVLESAGRTRMILNLVELVPYESAVEGNSIIVKVGSAGAKNYLKPTRETSLSAVTTKPSGNQITSVDFNRGEQGEGQLIVNLSNPKTDINVFVEGEEIKIDFKGLSIPEQFQRRYDVVDFATPVQTFEAKPTEGGALFSMKAAGEYDYLAYQADNQYVVSVKPLTAKESEERQKEFAFVGEKLSLNFQDIEVRAVLQLIADFTGLNLVASDTVTGRITLRLKNVPWDQALELVLKTKGLDQRKVGNVLMVAPASEIAERERIEIENNKQIEELAPLQTEFLRIRYAKADELSTLLRGSGEEGSNTVLSARGSVIVDTRTNSLLITETAQKLQEIRDIVNLLDIPVRQVLIEARIVIANSDLAEQMGIAWGVGANLTDNAGDNSVVIGDNVGEAGGQLTNAFNNNQIPTALQVDLGTSSAGSFAIGFIESDYNIQLELSAQESQGRGEIVSQPKVITGDKQEAEIKSGSEVPYQESAGNGETTISFKEAVLRLNVTPSITPDDRIIMDLVVNQDSVGDIIQLPGGGEVPTIDTTELTTQVLVANGETVVLGGVFRTVDVQSEIKIPVLGDIPYLGKLFSSTNNRLEKTETLIFITPRILADTLVD